MNYNASDRRAIKRAQKTSAANAQERIDFIVAAMGTKQGRAWFFDLIASCHVFADPFSGDALLEAYSKGERNVGLKVYVDIVSNCPDHFITMMGESKIKEIIDDRSSSADADPDAGPDDPSDTDHDSGA